jgi:hypothetical protein
MASHKPPALFHPIKNILELLGITEFKGEIAPAGSPKAGWPGTLPFPGVDPNMVMAAAN